MKPTETERTFSQEQARAMYAFIERIANTLGDTTTSGGVYPLGVEARQVLLDLQALDSDAQPATDGGEAARYTLATVWTDEADTKRWVYFEHPDGEYTEAEAQAECDRLNAAQTGGESSDSND